MALCECGCGEEVKLGRRFIWGHNRRGISLSYESRDAISKAVSATIMGHSVSSETRAAMSKAKIGRHYSPEHCTAISDATKGVLKSPETRSAMSKSHTESDKCESHNESMRGGNDICNHHYIYDHSDLLLNTVQMTRSDHSRLHQLLKRLGYIVPHINTQQPKGL